LSEFLPKRPGQEELQAIAEMFQASVDGELYDVEKWGNFYKPYGVEVPASAVKVQTPAPSVQAESNAPLAEAVVPSSTAPATEAPATAPAPAEPVAEAPAPAPAAESGEKPSADDILNMIRNRT